MPKKHLLQNTDSMKLEKLADGQNAKVTVQYIQNTHLYQKKENFNQNNIEHVSSHEDVEIENVEYLEENTNVIEYIEDSGGKEEDNFYPNAIHCLLDLYKNRYENLVAENTTADIAQPWHDIAKEMQESFFEFNEHQVKLKYASLREQYFSLHTKDEIENFDYFEQLHDIYKDKCKDDIIRGYKGTKIISYYKDEIFLQNEQSEINEAPMHGYKSEEIAHKEHEFIDLVEKELQAIEGRVQVNIKDSEIQKNENEEGISSTKLKSILSSTEQSQNKRPRLDADFCEGLEEKMKTNKYSERNGLQENCLPETKNDFSLYFYNQEQERRHQEKMSLLEKSLKIQERALEQQQQLLRELIKRLPS